MDFEYPDSDSSIELQHSRKRSHSFLSHDDRTKNVGRQQRCCYANYYARFKFR